MMTDFKIDSAADSYKCRLFVSDIYENLIGHRVSSFLFVWIATEM